MSSACGDPFSSLRAAAASVAGAVSTADVRAAAAHGSLAVLDLKARNREVYEGLELRRQGTADAKHALEKTNLQLQNLQYEKSHYAKEIQMCRDFRSAFADSDVGLVAEEEFLRRAPPELNPGAANTGGDSHASHQRMLNRLAFELAERKELGVRLQELKTRKKALQETNTSRRKLILALATELKSIKAACAPLAKLVALPDRTSVNLLPPPLRATFAALDGVAQPGDGKRFMVSVLGTPDAVGLSAEGAPEPGEAGEAREEADEEDESARRGAKRARAGPEVHPMSVLLSLEHVKEGTTSQAVLAFEWHPSRGILVPRVEEGDATVLLQGILGEDAAEAAGGGDEGEVSGGPSTLHWAQKLAGLDSGGADAGHAAAVVAALLAKM